MSDDERAMAREYRRSAKLCRDTLDAETGVQRGQRRQHGAR